MAPKVVCQLSFFTFAVSTSCVSHFLLSLLDLPQCPGLHGLLAHAPDLFDQAFFSVIGSPQARCIGLNNRQDRDDALSDLRMCMQFSGDFFVAEVLICHAGPVSQC
jgi:hypothetical protein